MHPITIIGGGLAGLSLAIGLRRVDVPVRVEEAGDYPRHRVCGEFISGLDASTIEQLGLAPALAGSVSLKQMRWYDASRLLRDDTLPDPARGISRWELDRTLANALVDAGGDLQTGTRSPRNHVGPGTVDCAGRQPAKDSDWIGLKCHLEDFEPEEDLEMHMSAQGYVGLSRIENARTNLCGLFRKSRIKPSADGTPFIFQYLRHCGFHGLLSRLEKADPVEGSECSVAALGYHPAGPPKVSLRLGDAQGLIPPFTGNGMTLAFESAALAVEPLRAYANEELDWPACTQRYRKLARARFGRRLAVARGLHRCLLSQRLLPLTSIAARTPLFPFQSLFRLTR
jgi:flavin-dependent dehydrogenase